ncbi:efflux RND transporter periplasmic adaptor subunit [Legionella cardiaca]|uniref:Efflux RND transporter periplasmic adaptor subunit n=1 Tax=Legionella cardiaca TaxID=1071983 RepID=A0ABY8AUV6_9GAMM|nr:efflux RND transporter periplasmic adaptor subunit [Legionella cardiaca]WED44464.1 efflux RND transporter periplasmic adaptor subunit [Legionella cardiaca]
MKSKFPFHRVLRRQTFIKCVLFLFACCLLTFAYYFFWGSKSQVNNDTLKIVEVEEIKLQNIQQTAELIGTIHPKHTTVLIAKANGMLDSLLATGQNIKKGTLIAKIDNPDMEKNHQLSETAERIARTQYERLSTLLKTGYVSTKEVEEKKQAWIEASKNLSQTKIELDTMRFYAPFDGIIGAYKKREGTQINIGDPVVTIYDPTSLTIDFDVPCTNLKTIREGQFVRVLGTEYRISHIQKMIDEETHMCPADVDIVCEDCIMGASVDVELVMQEKKKVVVIPYQAVFLKNGNRCVYVVDDHKIVLTPIQTGLQNKSHIEVISGLKPGQILVTKGQERLYPGMSVGIYKSLPTSDS